MNSMIIKLARVYADIHHLDLEEGLSMVYSNMEYSLQIILCTNIVINALNKRGLV